MFILILEILMQLEPITYTVSYDTRLNKITIAINYSTIIFNVFTEAEVIANQK